MKKYTLKQKLGKGGMGEVYLAHDNELNRDVAVKKLVLDPDLDINTKEAREIIKRFKQEAQAAARLNHPNIVTVHQVVQSRNNNYIVMELLKGKPLQEWLNDGWRFSTDEIVQIAVQVCQALEYAHKSGIVHRDIKPDNIFITFDLDVKINDFGVARVEEDALIKTSVGTFMGTPAYSSPEHWRGSEHVDGRSDIYSLGVVLYRMIAGMLPFKAENFTDLVGKIISAPPAALTTLAVEVPDELNQIIMKALHKDPEKRYQTAEAMAEALRDFLRLYHENRNSPSETAEPAEGPVIDEDAPTVISSIDIGDVLEKETEETQTGKTGASDSIADGGAVDFSTLAEPETIILTDLDFDDPRWTLSLFECWEHKALEGGNVSELFDRLLSIPVYTQPFSGGLVIDDRYFLFIWKGHIVQTLDLNTGETRETVMAKLPETASRFQLYSLPDGKNSDLPLVAATILDKREHIHRDIDSSIIDVIGMIRKMIADRFTGVVHLRYEKAQVYLGFYGGERTFILQSGGMNMDISSTIFTNLTMMIKREPFKADVYESRPSPVRESMRRFFQGAMMLLVRSPHTDINHTQIVHKKERSFLTKSQTVKELKKSLIIDLDIPDKRDIIVGNGTVSTHDLFTNDFGHRFAQWLLFDLFAEIGNSENKDALKYIFSWIPEIETIRFNYPIRDESGAVHVFDLVTMDHMKKILHLVRWECNGATHRVNRFLEDVVSIKKTMIKTGDIGGAFYVTPQDFSEETVSLYHEAVSEKKKQLGFGLLDSFTGYKGFIRIGKNRGFHFALITEKANTFNLIAPVL